MTEHYFSKKQTSPFIAKKIKIFARGLSTQLYTAGGVFSPKYLDAGTKILLDNAIMENDWEVLDLGCGYGPVGIVLMKIYKRLKVTFADVNERALKLCRMNLHLHRITGRVIESDAYDLVDGQFDTILLNPPQTAGKDVCLKMIEGAPQHLKQGGILQMVARHTKGGKSLSEHMEKVFGNVKDIAKKSGYRVYVSKKVKS